MPDPFYSQWLLYHLEPMPPQPAKPMTWFVSLDLLHQQLTNACRRAGRQPLDKATLARGVLKFFPSAVTGHADNRPILGGIRFYETNKQVGDVRYG
jgi:hypothetical protein